MKIFFLSWTIATVLTLSASGRGDDMLLEHVKEAFKSRADAGSLSNKEAAVSAFRKPFEGFDDAQKIKAFTLYLYDIDQNDERWSMSTAIIMAPLYAISDDPDFINDWSSLRQMLRDERDPRKFYLLSKLVPLMKSEPQLDFIAERTHMLFADGRVAKDEGEYTRSYAHDVSRYAYTAIIGNLRVLDAEFEPPPENLPHEERIVILAKWLKENWPGCEHIEITQRLSRESQRQNQTLARREQSPLPRRAKEVPIERKEANDRTNDYVVWCIGGGVIMGICFLLIRRHKQSAK